MNFCMYCGKPLNGNDGIFCPHCGKRLKPEVPEEQQSSYQSGSYSEPAETGYENRGYEETAGMDYDPGRNPETGYEGRYYGESSFGDSYGDPYGGSYGNAYEDAYRNGEDDSFRRGPAPDSGGRGKIIIAVLAVIIALLLIVAGFLMMKGSDSKDSASGSYNNDVKAAEELTEKDKEKLLSEYEKISNTLSERSSATATLVSTDVSDYPNVKLYFSVEDPSGETVTLNSAKVAVRERMGGEFVERQIKSFMRLEGNAGLSIDLVADTSGSMDTSLYRVQDVMTEFVESLDYEAGDRAELISFNSYIMYMCTYTNDVQLLRNGISNMTPYGTTALYNALAEGIQNAKNQTGARCVIAFTDGQDNESYYSPQEIVNMAQIYSVPVYIIGAGSVDEAILQNIAYSTGGCYWNINDIYDMNDILQMIYREQKAMYCVEYVSDSAIPQYSERDIDCVMSDKTYGCSVQTSFTPVETLKKTSHSSRYEVIKDTVSWSEANQACINRGGHLATITSQSEMDQLSALAQQAGLKYVWLGGYTSVRDGYAFGHWVTGEPFDYTAWYPGEPSRTDEDGTPEMYLMLWNVEGVWSWNDQRNDPAGETGFKSFKGATGYICEYED